jgi:hypothetical protein
MKYASFYLNHPHLRSERGWEMCDDEQPCRHAIAAGSRERFRRFVARIASAIVVYTTVCSCFMDTDLAAIAGTFAISAMFARISYVGLCAEQSLSDIPVVDRDG